MLICHEYPPIGSGIANVVFRLNNCLSKDHKVTVLSQTCGDINISSLVNILPGQFGLLAFWEKSIDYARKNSSAFDVIWFHSPLALGFGCIRESKKIIITFHTTYYGFMNAYKKHFVYATIPYYKIMAQIEKLMLKEISRHNILVTAVSPSVGQELAQNGAANLPFTVPNGIIHKTIMMNKIEARRLINDMYSLNLSTDSKVLFCSGRIDKQKQPLKVIEFFKKLHALDLNYHLIIVGKGALLKQVIKKAENQKNIHVLGFVPNEHLPILIQSSDAFLSLACYEGLPLTALEAASYNLPLILSNIPSHDWLFSSKLIGGLLINPNVDLTKEAKRVIDFFKQLSSDSSIDLDRASFFEWVSIADEYIKLIKNR